MYFKEDKGVFVTNTLTNLWSSVLKDKRNVFSVTVQDMWHHKRRHSLLMTLRSIGYMHCLTHWSGGVENAKSKKIIEFELFWYQNVPHVLTKKMPMMFLSTNKKNKGVWTFEVSCISWMEKSEVIPKSLQWKYRLISIINGWYHIISLVIGITFICFWYASISLLGIK